MTATDNTSSLLKLAFERVEKWEEAGLIVSDLKQIIQDSENISELIIDLEILVQKSSELQKRIASLPENLQPEMVSSWQTDILNPLNFEKISGDYLSWAKEHRIWEITMFNSLDKWLDLSLESEYDEILARLDVLDVSSQATIRPFTKKLSNPSLFSEIEKMLELAENSEQKQRETIRIALKGLAKSGIQTKDLENLPLMEAISEVEKLQSYSEISEKLKLIVKDRIQPFDEELAVLYVKKIDDRIHQKPENLEDLFEELYAVVDNFEDRLNKMNSILIDWKQKGVFFENKSRISKSELVHWEGNLEKTSEIIDSQLLAIEQGNIFEKLWPAESTRLSELRGNLDKVEEYNLELNNLKQMWKEYELKLSSLIQKWQFYGIDMKRWENRSDQEPRLAYNLLLKQEHVYKKIANLIQELEGMDVSFEGQDEVAKRLEFIRTQDLNLQEVELLGEWVQTQLRRRARHREMLEKEWKGLHRNGILSSDANTLDWTLAEFEEMIARGQKGELMPELGFASKSNKHSRMKRNAEAQITRWKAEGWDVSGLENLLSTSVEEVARALVRIRANVEDYPSLRRRLQMLPWQKNRDLALKIEQMSARPDELGELKSKFSTWVKTLATSPHSDEKYEISLFSAKTGRMTLLPMTEEVSETQNEEVILVEKHDVIDVTLDEINSDQRGELEEEIEVEQEFESEESHVDSNENEFSLPLEELETNEDTYDRGTQAELAEEELEIKETDILDSEVVENDIEETFEDIKSNDLEVKSLISVNQSDDSTINQEHLNSVSLFLNKIGLDEISSKVSDDDFLKVARRGLASMVGIEPRDSRVDRLLRLSLRLLPDGNPEDEKRMTILNALIPAIEIHHTWTKKRLQARRGQGTGDYLHDSALLGTALERIPGPGLFVPLSRDEFDMPASDNLPELSKVALELAQTMSLPTAGGIR